MYVYVCVCGLCLYHVCVYFKKAGRFQNMELCLPFFSFHCASIRQRFVRIHFDFPLLPSTAKKKKNQPLHCYLFFLFHPSLSGQKKEGNSSQVLLNTFNLSFAAHTLPLPPPAPPPPHPFLSPPPLLPFARLSSYLSISIPHLLSPSLSLSLIPSDGFPSLSR